MVINWENGAFLISITQRSFFWSPSKFIYLFAFVFFFCWLPSTVKFLFLRYSLVASWLSLLRNMLIIQGLGLCLGVINTLVCDCVHVNVCVLFPQGSDQCNYPLLSFYFKNNSFVPDSCVVLCSHVSWIQVCICISWISFSIHSFAICDM